MNRAACSIVSIGAALVLAGPAVASAAPCGGLRFDRGEIVLGQPLAAEAELSGDARACLSAVAAAISDRPYVRSVTVSVRMPDAQRATGAGLTAARAMRDALVDAGVQAQRVSAVAPAAATGEAASVRIAYVERPASRAIALIVAFGGAVSVRGPGRVEAGAQLGQGLPAYTTIETGAGAHARVFLADGSFAWIGANTEVRIGRIDLTAELKRRVQLDLRRGEIETKAVFGGAGSVFDVATRVGVAGVRGTTFRVAVADAGTRLETVAGEVELAGSAASVRAAGGYGSRVGSDGTPEQPRALLAAAQTLRPVRGVLAAGQGLSWDAVPGAHRYSIQLARDAEFSLELAERVSEAPRVDADELPASGAWFWRVRAVDADGFVGMPSHVYRFERGR